MKKRQLIVAGNWKMNKQYEEGRDLAKQIVEKLKPSEVLVILGAPFIHLKAVSNIIKDISNLRLAAQNCHHEESGAYTGEVSVSMLKSVHTDYVIIGHSERREYFNETNDLLAQKVDAALKGGLRPIYCCGEKLEVREANKHHKLVAEQLKDGLFHLSAEQFQQVVVAYEPVWAIGTGKTATPEQAQEMHKHIRDLVAKKYNKDIAESTTILYGGSVKPANAKELFAQPDVDGGLVGGASLKAEDFVAIIDSFDV